MFAELNSVIKCSKSSLIHLTASLIAKE